MKLYFILLLFLINKNLFSQIVVSEPTPDIQQKIYDLEDRYDALLRGVSCLDDYYIIKENGKLRLENSEHKKLSATIFTNANFFLSNYIPTAKIDTLIRQSQNTCLYEIPYLLKKDSILIITQEQQILILKWNNNCVIEPIPFVANGNEYYVITDTVTHNYGIMARNGNIILEPVYEHLIEEHFCSAVITDFENCIYYITRYMYPNYESFNKPDLNDVAFKVVINNYTKVNNLNFTYPFIVIPQTIYTYKLNKQSELGLELFDLENKKFMLKKKQ
jgi:hypothetical protein